MNIKKYDRFFAFGCSMTSYWWPTWADIIGREFDEYYNYGQSGAGNSFISNSIVEANKVHKFTKKDLVIVMWSGVTREDRYKNNRWETPGNIYTQSTFDNKFVKKWADLRFYFLRDMALIDLTNTYLKSLDCDFHMLQMAPFEKIQYSEKMETHSEDILDLYSDTLSEINEDFVTLAFDGTWPVTKINGYGGLTHDYHPTPIGHLSYLRKLFPTLKITDSMKELVNKYEEIIINANHQEDVAKMWNIDNNGRAKRL